MELHPDWPVITVRRRYRSDAGPLPIGRISGYAAKGSIPESSDRTRNTINEIASTYADHILPHILCLVPRLDVGGVSSGESCCTHPGIRNATDPPREEGPQCVGLQFAHYIADLTAALIAWSPDIIIIPLSVSTLLHEPRQDCAEEPIISDSCCSIGLLQRASIDAPLLSPQLIV